MDRSTSERQRYFHVRWPYRSRSPHFNHVVPCSSTAWSDQHDDPDLQQADKRTLTRLSRLPYQFQFPDIESPSIAQDAELVGVTFPADTEEGTPQPTRIRFHDYEVIYSHPGLYESLFHGRLECQSPQKLVSLLG